MNKSIYDDSTNLVTGFVQTQSVTQTTVVGTGIALSMTPHYGPNKRQSHFQAKLVIYNITTNGTPTIVFRAVVGDDSSFTNKVTLQSITLQSSQTKVEAILDFGGAQLLQGSTNAIRYFRLECDVTKSSGAATGIGYSAFLTKV